MRSTLDDETPVRSFSADCTVDAQFAQVMPGTLSVTVSAVAATDVDTVVPLLVDSGAVLEFCVHPARMQSPVSSAAGIVSKVVDLSDIRRSPFENEFEKS